MLQRQQCSERTHKQVMG